jgi:hypothetical protein
MKKNIYTFLCALLLTLSIPRMLFAADTALAAANHKTAVRCLKLAENSIAEKSWDNAFSQAQLGLSYDDSIADLWYIAGAAQNGKKAAKAEQLNFVMQSFTNSRQWVDYNRDGARILYADLLCDTGKYADAVNVLDSEPFIYSADAEYIRIKAYYRLHTAAATAKARDKVNAARRIYPSDTRFPRLFFRYEYELRKNGTNETENAVVQKIANSFIARMPAYDKPDAELEIYAALFTNGEKKHRLLQAFTAHSQEHPLYAGAALSAGLLTQSQAVDYFFRFASKTISLELLEDFMKLITENEVKKQLAAFLNAYDGILTIDTDGDLEPNLVVQYQRGRPQTITWDKENDGKFEWTVQCDFGVPVSAFLQKEQMNIDYGTYPALLQVVCKTENGNVTYQFADEVLDWLPCRIIVPKQFASFEGCSFFVPLVVADQKPLDQSVLISCASCYITPTSERKNGIVTFVLIDGKPQAADYTADGVLYAHAEFKNGLPVIRTVDNNSDGVFETTQVFGFDPSNELHQEESERTLLRDQLFNVPGFGSGVYIKMIQIDENGDTVPDFTEEYLAENGKISSWDFDSDGNWDVQYKRFPQKKGEELFEDYYFYVMPGHQLVTVTNANGKPVKVVSESLKYQVREGTTKNFYWIGESGTPENEEKVILEINQTASQGVSIIADTGTVRIFGIRIGTNVFAQLVPDSEIPAAAGK